MRVTTLTSNLQKKLSFLNHAVSQRSQLPILLTMLFETVNGKLKISTTDLEIGIETYLNATIEEDGVVAVYAKTFTDLINSLTEENVTLQTVDTSLEVITKKTKSVFPTATKEEFPRLYEEKGEKIAILEEDNLQENISSVVFASSVDTTRPALSGVLVRKEENGFLLVATDGYRLSLKHYITKENNKMDDTSIIVPARVLKELIAIKEDKKALEMFISSGSNQIIFEQEDTVLVGRLIEAEFPSFEKIIPSDYSVSIGFDREEMQKAVKTCSIFAKDTANIIKLAFKKDKIVISSSSSQVGENTVEVDARLSGEENEIAFNARYLLDFFANINAKNMVFEMTGPLNPGVFKIEGDSSFLHMIMPIRVQS